MSKYEKPKVTIELAEYNELLELKEEKQNSDEELLRRSLFLVLSYIQDPRYKDELYRMLRLHAGVGVHLIYEEGDRAQGSLEIFKWKER